MPVKKRNTKPKQPKASRPQMPGYGFPKGAKGLLPWTWAEQRLKKSTTTGSPLAARRLAAHHGRLGPLARRTLSVQHWSQVAKGTQLDRNPNCIVCTEQANEAVIVEGVAEIADVSARRKFLGTYTGKYKFDMSSMEDDILSMKEPVFAVRPKKAFGLYEKHFQGKSTRWQFN